MCQPNDLQHLVTIIQHMLSRQSGDHNTFCAEGKACKVMHAAIFMMTETCVVQSQSFSAGVGNWVADEILHQARIHPEQKANSLGGDQVAALHHQMQVSDPASFACNCHCCRRESVLLHLDSNMLTVRGVCIIMQDVLKIAVEAGADSEKYPVSWIFHQKVLLPIHAHPLSHSHVESGEFVSDEHALKSSSVLCSGTAEGRVQSPSWMESP